MSAARSAWNNSIGREHLGFADAQALQKMLLYPGLDFVAIGGNTQCPEIGHLQIVEPTGINSGKWLEVDVNIERHAVKTGASPDP